MSRRTLITVLKEFHAFARSLRLRRGTRELAAVADAPLAAFAAQTPPEGADPPQASTDTAKAAMAEAMAVYGAQGAAANDEDEDALKAQVEEAPIVRLANTIIQQAIKERASEFHVEPDRLGVRVRNRVDGVLHEMIPMPKYIQMPLTARYKVMARMDVALLNLPQTGSIQIRFSGEDYTLSVSSLPIRFGEKLCVRIYASPVQARLNQLGFTPEVQRQLEDLIHQPTGMIFVTGPAGSGRATTLYTLLSKMNTVERNIVAVEEFCKYNLPGVMQVYIHEQPRLTLAAALQGALLQNPDILMVGEIRDRETMEIALEGARSRLVLSPLRVADAPSALPYLLDMQVRPELVASTVSGVLAQRLVRKVCTHCKEFYEVPATDFRRFGFRPESGTQMVEVARGTGCERCRQTGYRGRIGVYELLRMNGEIAGMVSKRAPVSNICEAARANGMHPLREDGLIKVLEGLTTPEEVLHVIGTNAM